MYAALLAALIAAPQPAPDTAVVCPLEFREALGPWLEHRRRQGHRPVLLSSDGSPAQIRQRIRAVARGGHLRFVVLVGDADPGLFVNSEFRARCVPTHHAKARVNVLWGSEPHIGTDNYYADLDDDQVPDLAVGRLTADTSEQLRQMVAKILGYERSADFGPWRRRVNVVAGVGGLGPLADRVIESSTKYLLTEGVPADYSMSMTYASWRSPYCGDPRLFHANTLRRLNEGAWFWVYIGHGFHLGLDHVEVPSGSHHIFSTDDVARLDCEHGAPIALFLACYTGAFDATADCLAEEMLRCPGGPVSIVAASRVTMPYAMSVLATGLMRECFEHRRPTLGEALLHAKRAMAGEADDHDRQRTMLDAVAAAVSPAPGRLSAERAEHLLLLNLIGDPLLRLRYPRRIELQVPSSVAAGEPLCVTGSSPVDGPGIVELVLCRDRLGFRPPARREYPQSPEGLAEFQEVYRRANDRRLDSAPVTVIDGRFRSVLDVPEDAHGECHLRLFIEGNGDFASAAADIAVERQPPDGLRSARR